MWLANVDARPAKSPVLGTCVAKRIGLEGAAEAELQIKVMQAAKSLAFMVRFYWLSRGPLRKQRADRGYALRDKDLEAMRLHAATALCRAGATACRRVSASAVVDRRRSPFGSSRS